MGHFGMGRFVDEAIIYDCHFWGAANKQKKLLTKFVIFTNFFLNLYYNIYSILAGFWVIFGLFFPKTSKYTLKYAFCSKVQNMKNYSLYANRNPF